MSDHLPGAAASLLPVLAGCFPALAGEFQALAQAVASGAVTGQQLTWPPLARNWRCRAWRNHRRLRLGGAGAPLPGAPGPGSCPHGPGSALAADHLPGVRQRAQHERAEAHQRGHRIHQGPRRAAFPALLLLRHGYKRVSCPSCGCEEPDDLLILRDPEREHERADACKRCKSFVLCLDVGELAEIPDADVAALTMLPLEVQARKGRATSPWACTPWSGL